MRRSVLLLAIVLPSDGGCLTRPAPSDREREWRVALEAALPPGWRVLVVSGEPEENRFVCWLEVPGDAGRTRRVELTVTPHPNTRGGRVWSVKVHPPARGLGPKSVTFVAYDIGAEAGALTPSSADDPEAVEAARPLAEEAVRRVRGLNLF